ncbi:hypothetical protein BASA62_005800 [Batrachochytrium salamandrivorans]|nr:hypothetical protein BASA62_005800 [Batrachochytrium salamandrivorans]
MTSLPSNNNSDPTAPWVGSSSSDDNSHPGLLATDGTNDTTMMDNNDPADDSTPLLNQVGEMVVNLGESARAGASAATKRVVTFWNDFGDFVDKGPVVELGIGVISASAFSSVLTSFVEDLLTPPLSFLNAEGSSLRNLFLVLKPGLSNSTFYPTLEGARADGAVTVNFGLFANRLVSFFITMLIMFWFIRLYRQAKRQLAVIRRNQEDEDEPQKQKCQWCRSDVPVDAYRYMDRYLQTLAGMLYRNDTTTMKRRRPLLSKLLQVQELQQPHSSEATMTCNTTADAAWTVTPSKDTPVHAAIADDGSHHDAAYSTSNANHYRSGIHNKTHAASTADIGDGGGWGLHPTSSHIHTSNNDHCSVVAAPLDDTAACIETLLPQSLGTGYAHPCRTNADCIRCPKDTASLTPAAHRLSAAFTSTFHRRTRRLAVWMAIVLMMSYRFWTGRTHFPLTCNLFSLRCPAWPIAGEIADGFDTVLDAFKTNFAEGNEVGASFMAYIGDTPVVELYGGYHNKRYSKPYDQDSLQLVFSSSKVVEGIVVTYLVDKGLLDFTERISTYWPEFGQGNKENVTVQCLLGHRAGVTYLSRQPTLHEISDLDLLAKLLAEQPHNFNGTSVQGYHAVTRGWGMLVDPLPNGFKRVLFDRQSVSFKAVAGSQPKQMIPWPHSHNRRAIWATEGPSYSGITNAKSLAKFAVLMAQQGSFKGKQLISSKVIAKALVPLPFMSDVVVSRNVTFTTGGWGMGVSFPGSEHVKWIGWGGVGGSMVWWNPERNLSFAYVMNSLSLSGIGDRRSWRLIAQLVDAVDNLQHKKSASDDEATTAVRADT